MEAFSDGVLAIVITIMVLELSAPEEPTLGQSPPAALAVAHPLCHRLDGKNRFCRLAGGLYVLVAIIWLIPDRRIENLLAQ